MSDATASTATATAAAVLLLTGSQTASNGNRGSTALTSEAATALAHHEAQYDLATMSVHPWHAILLCSASEARHARLWLHASMN